MSVISSSCSYLAMRLSLEFSAIFLRYWISRLPRDNTIQTRRLVPPKQRRNTQLVTNASDRSGMSGSGGWACTFRPRAEHTRVTGSCKRPTWSGPREAYRSGCLARASPPCNTGVTDATIAPAGGAGATHAPGRPDRLVPRARRLTQAPHTPSGASRLDTGRGRKHAGSAGPSRAGQHAKRLPRACPRVTHLGGGSNNSSLRRATRSTRHGPPSRVVWVRPVRADRRTRSAPERPPQ